MNSEPAQRVARRRTSDHLDARDGARDAGPRDAPPASPAPTVPLGEEEVERRMDERPDLVERFAEGEIGFAALLAEVTGVPIVDHQVRAPEQQAATTAPTSTRR